MPVFPKIFYVLVDYPTLIVVPIILFLALAVWSRSRAAWLVTIAWVLYLVYELGMHAGFLCSADDCDKRTPLYVLYPLLALLSVVALVQVYVRINTKRRRERMLRSSE